MESQNLTSKRKKRKMLIFPFIFFPLTAAGHRASSFRDWDMNLHISFNNRGEWWQLEHDGCAATGVFTCIAEACWRELPTTPLTLGNRTSNGNSVVAVSSRYPFPTPLPLQTWTNSEVCKFLEFFLFRVALMIPSDAKIKLEIKLIGTYLPLFS